MGSESRRAWTAWAGPWRAWGGRLIRILFFGRGKRCPGCGYTPPTGTDPEVGPPLCPKCGTPFEVRR